MERNKELLSLLKSISEAKYHELTPLLVKVKDAVDKSETESKREEAKKEVLSSGLLPILILSLKQNFGKLGDGWVQSPKLARFLVDLCINASPSDIPNFTDKTLPEILDSVLYLAGRFQKKVGITCEESTRQQLLDSFSSIFDAAGTLLSGRQGLTKLALESIWFQQMLMSDDERTTPRIMALIQTVNKTRIGTFEALSPEVSRQIMDELVFKILVSKDPSIVSTASRTIIEICKSSPAQVKALKSRYQGLRMHSSRWKQEPFVSDLLLLLDTGSLEKYAGKKFETQATLIQSLWRGYFSRKKLRDANRALSLFQKSFREKRESEEKLRLETKAEAELQYSLAVRRRYNMRRLHRRQLHAIRILPSSKVERYLIEEQNTAAMHIQSAWRRYAVQKDLPSLRRMRVQKQAATKIQRSFRKYLARKRQDELIPLSVTLKVSEERRNELREQISEWREQRRHEERTIEETERLHREVQAALTGHLLSRHKSVEQHQHLEALMARVKDDADLLLDSFDQDIFEIVPPSMPFRSGSLAIGTKAREEHLEKLRQLNMPWWKKLEVDSDQTEGDMLYKDWRLF